MPGDNFRSLRDNLMHRPTEHRAKSTQQKKAGENESNCRIQQVQRPGQAKVRECVPKQENKPVLFPKRTTVELTMTTAHDLTQSSIHSLAFNINAL